MASNITLPSFQGPLLKSNFLGRNDLSNRAHKSSFTIHKQPSIHSLRPCAKFNLSEILGGRGLCNGEEGLLQELTRNVEEQKDVEEQVSAAVATETDEEKSDSSAASALKSVQEDAFEKELMGLTGGFPGGEKGLQKFIEKNPPPKKPLVADSGSTAALVNSKKPKAPELPLLLPGMIAIVNNPNSPYYKYCGIVQRITDGKAGVLFEGGNWDRLITFRLGELLRRDKGPPGKNPKSAVLEPFLQKDSD
ncbi:NAD(P)H-quinone oxidoreductase subunit S, chloroplastic [Prunus dulcis]|uniref:NAD(P)H-quinone oxidoreductase subunit S, chloroplastic n=1 Tax=Prunus dulcis TaxID=3755 RepID=UPI0014827E41|nr:NAD(P)H-quinone oxidoreductase subunit S, chloroplastic [Prunus dulcis]